MTSRGSSGQGSAGRVGGNEQHDPRVEPALPSSSHDGNHATASASVTATAAHYYHHTHTLPIHSDTIFNTLNIVHDHDEDNRVELREHALADSENLELHTAALDLGDEGSWMSINPARAIEEHLQSSNEERTSPASEFPPLISGSLGDRLFGGATDRDSGIAFPPPLFSMANIKMEGALPENDGMQSLRSKLQEIKLLAVSTEEKAMRMHYLMTQDYLRHKSSLQVPTEASGRSMDVDEPSSPILGEAALPIDPKNPYNLRPGDLDRVFSTLPRNIPDEGDLEGSMDLDEKELGCMHYKRNVKVQCFDCQRWFPCRHCHDQSNDLPFPHSLQRKKTQNMLCMLCKTPQPAAEVCMNCGEYAAWYFCPKCKLWDNDSNKRIYHCDDCGICRVGEGLGKDYVHCRRCNVCISISTSAAHPCIERATEGNCPLCLAALFESRTAVVSLPCGHYMHGECYRDLMAVTYKCPVCSKSAVNMELQWRKLDDEIAAQPMPEDEEDLDGLLPHIEDQTDAQEIDVSGQTRTRRPRQVWIGCNDCGSRSWTPFHWLGLKCQRCDSYNTNQMAPTAVNETDAERLLRQQQIHRHDFTGNAVLRDAGIGMPEPEEVIDNTLQVPESPSQQPAAPSSPRSLHSPRLASGAQSPGRYFVEQEPPRRPSFTTAFSAPSMPNLPTLSNLADMPRMPRMPNLPNLPNFRQNLPNMPNVDFPRFSPYEMIDAVSRSLSPMRYYLRGLDAREDEDDLDARIAARPGSVQSDPTRKLSKSKLRSGSEGSAAAESVDLWASEDEDGEDEGEDSDSVHALDPVDDSSSGGEDSGEEASDDEMGDADGVEDDGREEWELLGHR